MNAHQNFLLCENSEKRKVNEVFKLFSFFESFKKFDREFKFCFSNFIAFFCNSIETKL